MSNYIPVLQRILRHEGGYMLTDHVGDKGGQTYAGISRRANPMWEGWLLIDQGVHEGEELRDLVAKRYKERYWDKIKGDGIPSMEVAASMMSCAVLSGATNAIKLAQIVLDLKSDGVLGPKTMEKLKNVRPQSGDEDLFEARYALARVARYSELVRRRPKQAKWLRGWVNRALEDAK